MKSMKIKVNRLHVYLTLVCLCAGYLIAFSYSFTQENEDIRTQRSWVIEDQVRERIIDVNKENLLLEQQLRELQQRVSEKEEGMGEYQTEIAKVQKELEALRLRTGLIESQGPGVVVILEDSQFASDSANPNDYIVHEQDVRRVVNELFAAGAEGLSINDQRYIHSTAIRCVGPTIIVNQVKSTAPFVITSIGDPDTLYQALNLPGGIIDALTGWGISVSVEKKDDLTLPAYLGEL